MDDNAKNLIPKLYDDVVQPSAREVGRVGAEVVSRLLDPVKGLVWGYDQIRARLTELLEPRLAHVPKERHQAPPKMLAGPVFESLRFAEDEPHVIELYANLLATSMDSARVRYAHPSFVEIIRQLAPDEARIAVYLYRHGEQTGVSVDIDESVYPFLPRQIVRLFTRLPMLAGCEHPDLSEAYFDNLVRLGVVEILNTAMRIRGEEYHELMGDAERLELLETLRRRDGARTGKGYGFGARTIRLTALGEQFMVASAPTREESAPEVEIGAEPET
jgi:hypothetical protein